MSTREIAVLIWIFIIIVLAVLLGRRKGLLKSIYDVVISIKKLLLHPMSIFVLSSNILILIIIYTIIVKFDFNISIWYIKDYLIILFFSIYPVLEILKDTSLKVLFTKKKKELITFTAIPLFISSTYTFSIILEMVLIFVITILYLFAVFTEKIDKIKLLSKFFNSIIVIIGIYTLTMSVKYFIENIYDVLTFDFWLSFGLEIAVWLMNIPVIFITKLMSNIEYKIIFNSFGNNIFSYLRYYSIMIINRFKYREFFSPNNDIENYILNAQEFSTIGGSRIIIDLNTENVNNHVLLLLFFDAIYGKNNYTGIINKWGKYPNLIEIQNINFEKIAIWEEPLLKDKWKNKHFGLKKQQHLINNIYRLNNYSKTK
jgi:hypothetical protein